MRVLLKIAYDGTEFRGYARQPRLPTVEGEVLRALGRAKVISSLQEARFQSASRTDRGVSALGNAVAFNTPRAPKAAAGAFNSEAKSVYALGFAAVPDDFNARRARERWYRYLLSGRYEVRALREGARLFEGVHAFSAFVKGTGRVVREIRSVRVLPSDGFVAIDVTAPSFGWNMVRRVVAALVAVHEGRARLSDVRQALEGADVDFGLAPPEPLRLMNVDHGIPLTPVRDPALSERLSRLSLAIRLRAQLLSELAAAAAEPLRRR